jgi:nitrogen PTS system EIIA component
MDRIRLLARAREKATVALKWVDGQARVILRLPSCDHRDTAPRLPSCEALHLDGVGQKMDFEDLCQIVDTVVDLPVHSKSALLHDLAHRAALVLKVDDDTVFSALLKREELGSTGVGNGVALPHVRLEQVKKPFAIMARLKHPIDFDAIDGQPVDLVCLLLLLSKEKEQAQLNVLAAVARRLRTPEVLEQLRRAPNRVVLYNVMVGRTGLYRSQ